MLRNSYKIYIKKCDNVAINVVDSNTYPYCGLLVYCVYLCNKYMLMRMINMVDKLTWSQNPQNSIAKKEIMIEP
jgi:hypothetical protein